jgi:hypothetical protein
MEKRLLKPAIRALLERKKKERYIIKNIYASFFILSG